MPFAPSVSDLPSQDTGPVLAIKTADKGKAIVIPPKIDAGAFRSDNAYTTYQGSPVEAQEAITSNTDVTNVNRYNNESSSIGGNTLADNTPMTQAEKEAEKIRKMKELMNKGEINLPKR